MFGFIRNAFRNNTPEEFIDLNWLKDCSATWTDLPSSFRKRTENLTQRDLQILQSILSKHIRITDLVRKEIKEEALGCEVGDDLRSALFGEHRKVKAYLKKLADLQHRLKHKIKVGG